MQSDDINAVNLIPTNTPGKLYLSSRYVLNNYKPHGIGHMISVLHLDRKISNPALRHDLYDVEDSPTDEDIKKMAEILPQTTADIHASLTAGKNVAVHCAMGVSRSVTVVLDYLLTHDLKGSTLNEACKWLRKYRNIISPNLGFQRLLREKHENRKLSMQRF